MFLLYFRKCFEGTFLTLLFICDKKDIPNLACCVSFLGDLLESLPAALVNVQLMAVRIYFSLSL